MAPTSLVNPFGRIYIGLDAPDRSPAGVGDLWVDTTASLVKRCTSVSPFTWVSIEGGGAGAPTGASYVVMALDGTLTAERRLQVTDGLFLTDGGANADVTIKRSFARDFLVQG